MTQDLLIPISQTNQDNVLAVSSSGGFLPRIKLCQLQAKEVAKKQVKSGGNYVLLKGKDEIIDLGDEVEMIVCAGRAKALQTGDVILSIFDPKSEEFQRIQELSKDKNSGCMYGPEFLVWLPGEDTYATLFLNSPTARREGGAVHQRLGRQALLTSQYIETEKFSWYGPVCKDLSTPVTNMPPVAEIQEQINKFINEPSSKVRTADSSDSEGRER